LVNRLLRAAANKLADDREGTFAEFVDNYRGLISEYLLCRPDNQGVITTDGGTEAAQILFSQLAKRGDRVLAVNHEFGPILRFLQDEMKVEVIRLEKNCEGLRL